MGFVDQLLKMLIGLKVFAAFLLLCLLTTIFYGLSYFQGTNPDLGFFTKLFNIVPFSNLGDTAFSVIIIVIVYEWYIRSENEHSLHNQLFSENIVSSVLSETTLLKVVEIGLRRIVNDPKFGSELFDLIQSKAVLSPRRHLSLKYDATIKQIVEGNEYEINNFFDLRLIVSYHESRTINRKKVRFCHAKSSEEYHRLRELNDVEWKWLQVVLPEVEDKGIEFFTVEYLKVDGIDIPLDRYEYDGRTEWTGSVRKRKFNSENRSIEYGLNIKLKRNGHVLFVSMDHPTYDPSVIFDYAQSDIAYVTVVDGLTTNLTPNIKLNTGEERLEEARRISVDVPNAWVLPKSTIAFVWRLKDE